LQSTLRALQLRLLPQQLLLPGQLLIGSMSQLVAAGAA
jgi:hypothetical protein